MRFRQISWLIGMSLFLFISPGKAEEDSNTSSGFLPTSGQIFKPLLADPRELQFSVRPVLAVGHRWLGDADMGGYLGLYRWNLPDTNQALQLSAGGGAFGYFDLASKTDAMQSVDFYANLPLDYSRGPWAARFMLYHTSSHLGDDYLATQGITTTKHAWDNLRFLLSNNPNPYLRLYAGYNYALRTIPAGLGRNELQAGFECKSGWHDQGHLQFYWANDFQSWQRIQWNPAFTSQTGVKITRDPQQRRALDLFIEFEAGDQPQGQFYLQKQTLWDIGLKFELG